MRQKEILGVTDTKSVTIESLLRLKTVELNWLDLEGGSRGYLQLMINVEGVAATFSVKLQLWDIVPYEYTLQPLLGADFVNSGEPRNDKVHNTVRTWLRKNLKERISPKAPVLYTSRTDDPAVFRLASHWLKNCVHNHKGCRRDAIARKLPTRLLELGPLGASLVKLKSTLALDKSTLYMTLSHCWGDAEFLKLTSSTFDELSAGIPVSSLAQTFQDAIRIAQELGVFFLWIDSLCIFQDSLEDWQREAPLMHNVYMGSHCSIAASASSNSEQGCFRNRDSRFLTPFVVQPNYPERQCFGGVTNGGILVEASQQQDIPHDNHQPLFTRGWVLQERLLAPRVLHFGSEYIFWECEDLYASEIYPRGLDFLVSPLKLGSAKARWEDRKSREAKELDKVVDQTWRNIVLAYSRCSLTQPGDKLVAISGISREMQRLGKRGGYLAGLWGHDIQSQLLWHGGIGSDTFEDHADGGQRPLQYRAPTWSWACLDGIEIHLPPVEPKFERTVSTLTSCEAIVERLTDDPFGQIKSAYLRCQGTLWAITVEPDYYRQYRRDTETCRVSLSDGIRKHTITGSMQSYVDVKGESLKSPTGLYFCPLYRAPLRKGVIEGCEGLILRATGRMKGQFERCGVLQLLGPEEDTTGLYKIPRYRGDREPVAAMNGDMDTNENDSVGEVFDVVNGDSTFTIV